MGFLRRSLVLALVMFGVQGSVHADLVHLYTFNDGTADDSVGGANGTLMNGATVVGGKLVLNNTSAEGPSVEYAQLPANVLPTSGGAVTIEEWFTSNGSGAWARGFDFGAGAGTNFFFTPMSSYGDSRVRLTTGGGSTGETGPTGAPTLNNNVEHMIAAVISDSTQTISYYIDGNLYTSVAEGANTLTSLSDSANYLGRSQYSSDPGLNGSIDELRIDNNALSATQIGADFINGPTALVPEPGSWILLALGLGGLATYYRRPRDAKPRTTHLCNA